jgi:hypothetical protein
MSIFMPHLRVLFNTCNKLYNTCNDDMHHSRLQAELLHARTYSSFAQHRADSHLALQPNTCNLNICSYLYACPDLHSMLS